MVLTERPIKSGVQVHGAAIAEAGDRIARLRVERVEVMTAVREQAFFPALAPVRDAAIARRAGEVVRAGLLHPPRSSVLRIEGFGEAHAVRRVHHAVDHDRG